MAIPEKDKRPSKRIFKDGFDDGLTQGRVEVKNGSFNMDAFGPTIEDLNFNDAYEIGYELGYMRAKMESLGFDIGKGFKDLQAEEGK